MTNLKDKKACWDCLHFKTRVLNEHNAGQYGYGSEIRIQKRIRMDGRVRTFRCSKHQTPSEVYIENASVKYLSVPACIHFSHMDGNE